MAKKSPTDAQSVLENIRSKSFADSVTADMLQAVYTLEHDKQFEDERGDVERALRDLIVEAVGEPTT